MRKSTYEKDRLKLKGLSYIDKLSELEVIGPNYGVAISAHPTGRNSKDVNRSMMIRTCPVHGAEEVRMAAFTLRGNFGCPVCSKYGDITDNHTFSSVEVSQKPRSFYVLESVCGKYTKVGVTRQNLSVRIRQVGTKYGFKVGKATYIELPYAQSAILESKIKQYFGEKGMCAFGSKEVFVGVNHGAVVRLVAKFASAKFTTQAGIVEFPEVLSMKDVTPSLGAVEVKRKALTDKLEKVLVGFMGVCLGGCDVGLTVKVELGTTVRRSKVVVVLSGSKEVTVEGTYGDFKYGRALVAEGIFKASGRGIEYATLSKQVVGALGILAEIDGSALYG